MNRKVEKTEQQWRELLSDEQYVVCREKGTERPFTGEYWDCEQDGVYQCVACGEPLFDSQTKFDAGCGWPSYFAPIQEESIEEVLDTSHNMVRTEVLCQSCGSHLGHVFPDGPKPTGLRYCINSVAVKLKRR